jgi:hypothetical protein
VCICGDALYARSGDADLFQRARERFDYENVTFQTGGLMQKFGNHETHGNGTELCECNMEGK